jgi:hypothetical protein
VQGAWTPSRSHSHRTPTRIATSIAGKGMRAHRSQSPGPHQGRGLSGLMVIGITICSLLQLQDLVFGELSQNAAMSSAAVNDGKESED